MSEQTLAAQIWSGRHAESLLEDRLSEAGIPDDTRTGFDDYDCSMELYELPADWRMSEAAQKVCYDAGFQRVFCNHVDKWQTHYSFNQLKEFAPSNGWRVSYGHDRGDGTDRTILLEAHVPSWPQDWFETGYCKVIGSPPKAKG